MAAVGSSSSGPSVEAPPSDGDEFSLVAEAAQTVEAAKVAEAAELAAAETEAHLQEAQLARERSANTEPRAALEQPTIDEAPAPSPLARQLSSRLVDGVGGALSSGVGALSSAARSVGLVGAAEPQPAASREEGLNDNV